MTSYVPPQGSPTPSTAEPVTAAGRRFVDRHGTGKQLEICEIEWQARAAERQAADARLRTVLRQIADGTTALAHLTPEDWKARRGGDPIARTINAVRDLIYPFLDPLHATLATLAAREAAAGNPDARVRALTEALDDVGDFLSTIEGPAAADVPMVLRAIERALAATPEHHEHRPEYPSACTGCEHLAADLAARLPEGLLPTIRRTPEPDARVRALREALGEAVLWMTHDSNCPWRYTDGREPCRCEMPTLRDRFAALAATPTPEHVDTGAGGLDAPEGYEWTGMVIERATGTYRASARLVAARFEDDARLGYASGYAEASDPLSTLFAAMADAVARLAARLAASPATTADTETLE